MTDAEYRAVPALHFSALKDLEISNFHFWYRHVNPNRPEPRESEFMDFGNALHCAILYPDEIFREMYACEAVMPEDVLDTVNDLKAYLVAHGVKPSGVLKDGLINQVLDVNALAPIKKLIEADHARLHEGKTVLSCDDWARLNGCIESLRSEPKVMELLSEGEPEVPLFVIDPEIKVPLKCRLDWRHPSCTVDLKSFSVKRRQSVDQAVSDAIWNEAYLKQGWLYSYIRALDEHATTFSKPFVNVFVESDPPHEVRIRQFQYGSDLYWQQTSMETQRLIKRYADCVETYGEKPWRDAQHVVPMDDSHFRQLGWT